LSFEVFTHDPLDSIDQSVNDLVARTIIVAVTAVFAAPLDYASERGAECLSVIFVHGGLLVAGR
jgi:hypothetical protein